MAGYDFSGGKHDWMEMTDTDYLASWNVTFDDGFQFDVVRPGSYIWYNPTHPPPFRSSLIWASPHPNHLHLHYQSHLNPLPPHDSYLQLRPQRWIFLDKGWEYQLSFTCRGRPRFEEGSRKGVISAMDGEGKPLLYREFDMGKEYATTVLGMDAPDGLRQPIDLSLSFGDYLGGAGSWGQCRDVRLRKKITGCTEEEQRECSSGFGEGLASCENGRLLPCQVG